MTDRLLDTRMLSVEGRLCITKILSGGTTDIGESKSCLLGKTKITTAPVLIGRTRSDFNVSERHGLLGRKLRELCTPVGDHGREHALVAVRLVDVGLGLIPGHTSKGSPLHRSDHSVPKNRGSVATAKRTLVARTLIESIVRHPGLDVATRDGRFHKTDGHALQRLVLIEVATHVPADSAELGKGGSGGLGPLCSDVTKLFERLVRVIELCAEDTEVLQRRIPTGVVVIDGSEAEVVGIIRNPVGALIILPLVVGVSSAASRKLNVGLSIATALPGPALNIRSEAVAISIENMAISIADGEVLTSILCRSGINTILDINRTQGVARSFLGVVGKTSSADNDLTRILLIKHALVAVRDARSEQNTITCELELSLVVLSVSNSNRGHVRLTTAEEHVAKENTRKTIRVESSGRNDDLVLIVKRLSRGRSVSRKSRSPETSLGVRSGRTLGDTAGL